MGKHMDMDTKANILYLFGQGMLPKTIALSIKKPRQTVETFIQRWQKTKTIINKHACNKKPAIDQRTANHLARLAIRNRRSSARELKQIIGIQVSDQTVINCLKKKEINSRRPVKKPSLNYKQKMDRLMFALAYRTWTENE